MAKRIKNLTAGDLFHTNSGINFIASSYTQVDETSIAYFSDDGGQLWGWFNAGSILFNDGTTDYTDKYEGYHRFINGAFGTPFIPLSQRTNEFLSTNLQEALEEIDFRAETNEPTGFVNRADSVISFDNASLTFRIAPVATHFDFLCAGKRYIKSAPETIAITDTEGTWFFYYEEGVLTASQTAWTFGSHQVFIANGWWDADNNRMIRFGEERHGCVMDWATHAMEHLCEGSKVRPNTFAAGNYIVNGDGSLDSHCQLSIANGYLHDEDIQMYIQNSATPTNPFEQKLSTIAWLPMYYKSGVNGYPRRIDATAFPVASNSPNTIYYNSYTGGTWGLTNVTSGWYTAVWIMVTNSLSEPIIGVLGQYQAPSYILAEQYNSRQTLNLTNVASQEFYLLNRIIVQTSTAYTNTPKAAIRGVVDAGSIIVNYDRYAVNYNLNGLANTGKYLEIYPGQTTDTSPFIVPEDSFIRTITLRTTANSSGVMGYYRFSNLTTPFYQVTFTNQTYAKADLSESIAANEGVAIKAISGSFNKPHGSLIMQTGG